MNTNNQQIAFEKFKHLKVGALFMKMGTGKTKVAIELVNFNDVDLLVCVCPFSTKDNIQKEIDKWQVNCEYVLIGYETIQSSAVKFLELKRKMEGKRCFIIADESIFIKNEETKRFKRLLQLRELCEYALILNGTPITKNEWDLYNQMYFLSTKLLNMNRPEFLQTFFKHIIYKKQGQKEKDFYKFSEVNAEYLKKLIEPYIFECDFDFDKNETKQTIWVNCKSDDYVRKKEEKLKIFIENGNSEIIINMLQELNSIASRKNEKNDVVCEYIKNRQVIVYCAFLEEVEYISKNVDCYVFTGKTKNRKEIIEQFKNGNKPLIMTYGVGSFSLNLQFCNEIVRSSLLFDYGKIEQSNGRIKRIGQENDIKYTNILSDFGINKMILENLERKQTLENLVKEKLGDFEWIKSI